MNRGNKSREREKAAADAVTAKVAEQRYEREAE